MVVQLLIISLSKQRTQVQSLVRGTKIPHATEELSPGTATTEPAHHNSRVRALQQVIPSATQPKTKAKTYCWAASPGFLMLLVLGPQAKNTAADAHKRSV